MAEERDDKPFLSRWSERKRQVRAEEEGPEAETEGPRAPAPAQASPEVLEANRATAEAIDLETLTDKSDYNPFFRPGVPAALKRAALRKLWRSNPVFAVLDGLDDHFLDFRWPESGSEVVKTAWKVGRGFVTGEDQAAAEERSVGKPVEGPAAVRAPASEAQRASVEQEKAGEAPSDAEADGAGTANGTHEPEPTERPKVGLTRRIDMAAFAGKDEG